MFAILHILKYCCVKDWEPSIWAFYTFYIAIFENINIMQSLCTYSKSIYAVGICIECIHYCLSIQQQPVGTERLHRTNKIFACVAITINQRTPENTSHWCDINYRTGVLSLLTAHHTSRSLLLWRNVLLILTLVALWVGCYFILLRVLRPLVIIWRIIWCSLVANPCL